MAWDSTKPANNSKLVSSEIRANWIAIENSVLYDGSVAGPISGSFDITSLPSNLKFTRNVGGASYAAATAVTVENDGTSQYSLAFMAQAEGSGGTYHTASYGKASGGTSGNVGTYGIASGTSSSNIGVRGDASGGSNNYGLYGTITGTGSTSYAVYGLSGGGTSLAGYFYSAGSEGIQVRNVGTSGICRAVYGIAYGSGGTSHTGLQGAALGTSTNNYGVHGTAEDATNNYGVYGIVSTNASTNKAIYGRGSGAGHDSYAGYFEYGKTHVAAQDDDKFIIGTEFWIGKGGCVTDAFDTSFTVMNSYNPGTGVSSYALKVYNMPSLGSGQILYGMKSWNVGGGTSYGTHSKATGFGGTTTTYGVYGVGESATNNYGLYGEVSTNSATNYAIHGEGAGKSSYAGYFNNGAVYATCSRNGNSGDSYVIEAENPSTGGTYASGMRGAATSTGGSYHTGVYGQAAGGSVRNVGLSGAATGSAGDNRGVYGYATGSSTANYAVDGWIIGTAATDVAIRGVGGGGSSYAGYFTNSGTQVVYAYGTSTGSTTVIEALTNGAGGTDHYGVKSTASGATNNYAIYGTVVGTGSTSCAIYGVGGGGSSYAGYFTNSGTDCLYAVQTSASGVSSAVEGVANGSGGSIHRGIYGSATGATNNYAVYGVVSSNSSTNRAVYGYGAGTASYAGYFENGKVHIDCDAANSAFDLASSLWIVNDGASNRSCSVRGQTEGSGGTYHWGGWFTAANASTESTGCAGVGSGSGTLNRGIYGIAWGGTTNQGVYGEGSGTDATDYGIYGKGGGGDSYAGYFENGRVHIEYDYSADTTNREECAALNIVNQGTGAAGTDDSSTGIHLFVDGSGGDRHYGIYAEVNGGGKSNTGIVGEANSSGATDNNTGVYGLGEGGASNYGVYGRVDTNTATSYGIYGQGYGTTSYSGRFTNGKVYVDCDSTAVDFSAPSFYVENGGTSANYKVAISGNANGSSGTNVGIYGVASGATNNYAIMGYVATNGSTYRAIYGKGGGTDYDSYAGYFEDGRVYATNARYSTSSTTDGAAVQIHNTNTASWVPSTTRYATGLSVTCGYGASTAGVQYVGIMSDLRGTDSNGVLNEAIHAEVDENDSNCRAGYFRCSGDQAYAILCQGNLYSNRLAIPSTTTAPTNASYPTGGAQIYYDYSHFADRGRLYIYNQSHGRWDYIDADGHL